MFYTFETYTITTILYIFKSSAKHALMGRFGSLRLHYDCVIWVRVHIIVVPQFNLSYIIALSQIQFNSRWPTTSNPLTPFAQWDLGRCLSTMPAPSGQFSAWKLQSSRILMVPTITLPSPCKTCLVIYSQGTQQCDRANWILCSHGLMAMHKTDAVTQWTKSLGGEQESPQHNGCS